LRLEIDLFRDHTHIYREEKSKRKEENDEG